MALKGILLLSSQFKNAISNIGELGPAVGLLSAQHRDHWAKDHKILEELDPENAKSFSWIESALFCVCLDHRPIPEDLNSSAKNVFHGFDARNRWFDKSISLIVTNDGRAGLNGEHSPCDALVPAFVFDYAIRNEFKSIEMGTDPEKLPFKLFWKINTQISKSINNATAYAAKCIGDSDVHVLHFADYGASFIKKSAQVSPDFYAQACLQIAFKRIHKFQTAVYETASTRIYSHARTETCRVLSNDMKAFVDCLDIDVAVMRF
jgi:carnitine O-acetyltransferase